MNNETQPTYSKVHEFRTEPDVPKRASLLADFAKQVFFLSRSIQHSSWKERISRFFYPTEEKKHFYSKQEGGNKSIPSCLPSIQVSQNEADAFRMKAITLMKSQGIPFDFKALRDTPILTNESGINPPILSCYQILSPFPGEIVELKGSFKRNGIKQSTPIPDSFQLLSRSQQTGFPHPSQHNGWALDGCLVEHPSAPHEITQRKLYLARELVTNEAFLEQAKSLFKLKQMELTPTELIALHRQLAHAMVQSHKDVIDHFFDQLLNQKNPYQVISNTYTHVNQAIFHHKLSTSDHPFISCLKERLVPSVKRILNQEMLTVFDQKLQLAANKQVTEFMTAVDLKTLLKSDIALFLS